MDKQNPVGLALSRLLAQVVAIEKVIGSEVMKGLAANIPSLADCLIIKRVMVKADQIIGLRSSSVTESIRNVMCFATDEAATLRRALIAAGADAASVPEVEVDVLTLRSVDRLLAPRFLSGSVRFDSSDVATLRCFVSTFAFSQAVEVLSEIIATYRFEEGDYDKSILAERLFCEAAGFLLPLITDYHSDLLVVDRDAIRRMVEDKEAANSAHPELLICAKVDGCGTWCSPFNATKGVTVTDTGKAFFDAPLVVRVGRPGVERLGRLGKKGEWK